MQGTIETRIPFLTSLSYLQNQSINQENTKSQEALTKSIEHISTGLRVIDAGDDLAGFAIADRLDVQVQGMNKALQNTNEALSAARIAEGALTEYMDILGYMKELAEKASNSSLVHSDRVTLQEEVANFQDRLRSISHETAFMGRNLLDGTYKSQNIQVGQNVGHEMKISLKSARPDQVGLYEVVSAGGMNDAGNFWESIFTGLNEVSSLDSMTIQGLYTQWATNVRPISSNHTNESSQNLTFTVTNDYNALFSSQPAIDISGTTGTLSYTLAADMYGDTTVTVVLYA
ncbi:MAG: flagellin [Candidatus Magnetoglobus multicellularis str. Araruama]|uniref:Flagellin n=1 Tax=Candidatus Magnetoglobus multicellularis str. Araruama TaxID=890399 RepID=A0A1V1NZM8_9BACT|nr:MAG: flagellin [Candidatus Magnetoglobus multicellularis str. Araruama]